MKKNIALFILTLNVLLISACSQPINSTPLSSSQIDEIFGQYRLVSVNEKKVPTTVKHGKDIQLISGLFQIAKTGRVFSTTVFIAPNGSKLTRKVQAEVGFAEDELVFDWKGAGQTRGQVVNDVFTMDNHGMKLKYQKLTDTTETNQKQKTDLSLIDDFESGLVSGWTSNQHPLGFSTFKDYSGKSKVAITTTKQHPKRSDETADNTVLKIVADVKQWAGLVHNFENDTVGQKAPQDWRDYEGISFWLFGLNSGNSLYIEVLDNHNPTVDTPSAELYTHLFKDNFSGWKKITLPFSVLTRKEIGNNAPNDGLGLDKVHGWAFGIIGTDGEVTYYLDDIRLVK